MRRTTGQDSTGSESRRLRVVLVDVWCFIPYYQRYLYSALKNKGIDVKLAAASYFADPGYLTRSGVHQRISLLDVVGPANIRNPRARQLLKAVEYGLNMLALTGKLLISRPDIVHVQWLPLLTALNIEVPLLRLWKLCGLPLVYTVHNVLPHDCAARHHHRYATVYHMADALVCHTEESRTQLIDDFGICPEKICVIPHGPLFHDLPRPSPEEARRELGYAKDDFVVLWQGVLAPYKGLDFLISAWKSVQESCPRARLLIAGTGKDHVLAAVRRRVQEAAVEESVRLDLRYLAAEEISTYFQAADVLALPYEAITMSGALMTALTYGKPIVATDLPAFREVLTAEGNALLVPYGDTAALSLAILRLVQDERLRSHLAGGVERLNITNMWERIAEKTEACYRSLISHGTAPALALRP
jgi:glycosyltransferase involved in cell wall biosynthesis